MFDSFWAFEPGVLFAAGALAPGSDSGTSATSAVAALLTLTLMEVVLGIDNIIFIAVLAGRLPADQQERARKIGLGVALGSRLLLLFALSFLMNLHTVTLFRFSMIGIPETWFGDQASDAISIKDLILIVGGLFLIAKSTSEIHHKLEGETHGPEQRSGVSFGWVLAQIALLDIVFSLDSVITAVGMARDLWIMITAMIVSVGVMLLFAEKISTFVNRHPSVKILALSFLILIGVLLVAEGFNQHIPKGYVYFAMAFSVTVELLNMRLRTKAKPVELHH